MENRIIKFRGKHIKNGAWLYGDLLQSNEGSVYIGVHGQYIDDGYHFNDMYDETCYVDEDTIGQFTGLFDKNGKEIYEGDIIEITNPNTKEKHITTVKWNLKGYYAATMENNGNVILGYIDKSLIRIIGNIHYNPELISNKQ